jgi:glycosyltransferase involved in cell wall biosynthesis
MIHLTVLIPTTPSRFALLNTLLGVFAKQIRDTTIEVIIYPDQHTHTIGEKRNSLLEQARGKFLVFVDDDDMIHPQFCETLNRIIVHKPNIEYIGYGMKRYFDGVQQSTAYRSIKYPRCYHDEHGSYRHISHTNPILSSIAKQFKFLPINKGEDTDWCKKIFKSKKIKHEFFYNGWMYEQRYKSKKSPDPHTKMELDRYHFCRTIHF